MRIITCIEDPVVIGKMINHLDAKALKPEQSMRPPCRAPLQRELLD